MRWAYLIFVSGRPLGFVDSSLEPTNFLPSVFPLFSLWTEADFVEEDGTDNEQGEEPTTEEDRDEWPEDSAPHARYEDNHPRYSQGDCGKNGKDESTRAIPL